MDVENLQRLFVERLNDPNFTRTGARKGELDVSGNCRNPTPVVRFSRQSGDARNFRAKEFRGLPLIEITFMTRCRQCPECRKAHASEWRKKAISEINASERTWFGTLTLRPEVHFAVDVVCSAVSGDFEALPEEQKFPLRAKEVGYFATKYLKRLRKESGHRFRYLLVTEMHNSQRSAPEMLGRPHLHMLIHEFTGSALRKRSLEDQWPYGHSSWRLTADARAAFYVAKYLTKAVQVRTRASQHYGTNSSNEMYE